MTLTRRTFTKALGLFGLGSAVPVLTACPAWISNVYSDIIKYGPVALSAFASVLSILSGGGVAITPAISVVIALVNKGIADLQASVTAYQKAPATSKQGLLGGITEGLTVAETNIQQFWNDLTIPDPKLASLVEGLLGVITSTLMGFQASIPSHAPSAVATAAVDRKAAMPRLLAASPKARTVSQFRSEFNALLPADYKKHAI